MNDNREYNEKLILKNKTEVAKFVKYVITDLLNGVSQGNMFVYDGVVYTVLIAD